MSPKNTSSITDSQSEKTPARRGRPPFPRDLVLASADQLLSGATAPKAVTMDDFAAAAGVGKATLFRAFGSRDGLLDALLATHLETLREAVERDGSPVGPSADPADRVVAILGLLLTFKLENPHLTKARELSESGLLQAPHYVWTHRLLRDLLDEAGAATGSSELTAHLLLGALRTDVIAELLAAGQTPTDIHRSLNELARRLLQAPEETPEARSTPGPR